MTLDLDPALLARALGRAVPSYTVEAIDPHLRLHAVTGGVWRVRAGADTCVVKVVRHGGEPDRTGGLWLAGTDVAHRNYWKREWLAFDSGLLAGLPGRLRAPRALLTTQHGDGECWIWMEDVRGRTGGGLEVGDYATLAFALGSTQGAYAAGTAALPDHDWLSRDWLRGWVQACERFATAVEDDTRWHDPRLADLGRLRPRVAALWARRDELLAVTDDAPATVSHWDFWPPNLYLADDGDAVAIDWSQVGIGALAQDLDQITLDPVWMQVRPDEPLDRLEQRLLAAYLDGLRSAGCDVDERQLRRWYAAAAAARYAWLAGGQPDVVDDPEAVASAEHRHGRRYDDILAARTRVLERAVRLGEWVLGEGETH